MLNEIGREPTPEELAEKLGMPLEKVRKVLKIAKEPLSLETPIGDEEDSHLGDFIEDKNAILPIDAAIQSNLRETTTRVLASLTPREERVLRMRFGIGMNTDHTLEEVGQQFSVTRERIRQIEAKALRKLKHPSGRGSCGASWITDALIRARRTQGCESRDHSVIARLQSPAIHRKSKTPAKAGVFVVGASHSLRSSPRRRGPRDTNAALRNGRGVLRSREISLRLILRSAEGASRRTRRPKFETLSFPGLDPAIHWKSKTPRESRGFCGAHSPPVPAKAVTRKDKTPRLELSAAFCFEVVSARFVILLVQSLAIERRKLADLVERALPLP